MPTSFDLAAIAERLGHLPSPEEHAGTGPSAAVAAVLRDGPDGAEVLLIRRAERAGDPWSGHMAFPGGRRDPGDRDLYATAVRETREEVGLELDAHASLLGRLAEIPAMTRSWRADLTITPFVFALHREAPLAFDAREVAEALWTPLAPLARGELAGTLTHEIDGTSIELPCWRIEGRVVWGLTYRMIRTLFEAIGAV